MTTQVHKRHALRAKRFSRYTVRSDALIIGPSGELVEAHAPGDAIPAIPQPVVGRIPTGIENKVHAPLPTQPVTVIFTGASASMAVPGVSVQAISTANSPTVTPLTSHTTSLSALPTSTSVVSSSATSTSASIASSFTTVSSSTDVPTSSQTSSTPLISSTSAGPPIATPTQSAASGKHGPSLSVAIVFAALAGFAAIVALFFWFMKIRAKSRRQDLAERTTWPWDRDDRQIEAGHAGSHDRLGIKSAPSLYSVLPLPPGLVGRDEIMHDSHHVPMPQSPYRLVSNDLHQSVYDLAPEMGALRVANYVPGDSRATSRLGSIAGQQSSSTEGQNASLDDFAMLKHPWPASRNNSDSSAITVEKKDPYYSLSDECAQQSNDMPGTKPDNWISSLRSNISNALQVVVGGSNPTANTDCYTAKPMKTSPSRQGARAISRQNSVQSQNAPAKGKNFDAGRCIDSNNRSAWFSQTTRQQRNVDTSLPVPPLAIVKNRDRECGSLSRASSVYSTTSASRVDHQSTSFGLPPIPMSRSGSQSSLQQAVRGEHPHHQVEDSEADGETGLTRNRSPSMMSPTSRTTSSQSDALTEQERFASDVFKERRKRSSDVVLEAVQAIRPHDADSTHSQDSNGE